MASLPTGIVTDQSRTIGGGRSEFRFARVESVRPTDDRYCGHIGQDPSPRRGAAQPPMRESSFEGRPATLKLAQCVFSESTLFWKILVTRVKRIQQGAANKAIRDCCETGISVCGWKPVSERTQFHRGLFCRLFDQRSQCETILIGVLLRARPHRRAKPTDGRP